MTDKEQAPEDATKLPPEVEAAIAYTWSDNPAAAQLTRSVARAALRQNMTAEKVREMIQSSGRVVD